MGLKSFTAGALAAAVIVPSSFALAQTGSTPSTAAPRDAVPTEPREAAPAATEVETADARPAQVRPASEPEQRPERPARFEQLRLACRGIDRGEHQAIVCKWSQARHPDFAAYRLWRSDREQRGVVFRTDDVEQTRYLDTDVRTGVVYVYKVEAINRAGETIGASDPVRAMVREREAEELRLACEGVASERSGIACRWTPSKHPDFAGYVLWRGGDGERTKVFTSRDREATRAFDGDVDPGQTYIYRLHVLDADGNVIGHSNPARAGVPAGTADVEPTR